MDKEVIAKMANDYEKDARRPLTFAERKVNLSGLKKAMQQLATKMDAQLTTIKTKFLAGEINEKQMAIEVAKVCTATQKEAFEYGKQTASNEMKVHVKPTHKDTQGMMLMQNKQVIEKMIADIKKKFESNGFEFASENGIISQFFNGLKSLYISGAINLGRETVFEQYPDKVYAFQYSAILDERTTAICRGLDGIVVKPGSNAFQQLSPPRHWNCRSIWVEILTDEMYKPEFTKSEKIPADIGKPPTVEDVYKREQRKQKIIDAESDNVDE